MRFVVRQRLVGRCRRRERSLCHHHHHRQQCHSRWLSSSSSSSSSSLLGLGGHKWSRVDPHQYASVVQSAVVTNGWDTIEAGPEGGDLALANMLKENYQQEGEQDNATTTTTNPPKLHVLTRIGYRTLDKKDSKTIANDIVVQSERQGGEGAADLELQLDEGTSNVVVVHNVGREAVDCFLEESPLLSSLGPPTNVNIIPMIHNPEEMKQQQGPDRFLDRLTDAFCRLEEVVANNDKNITTFGVVSNGLSLPPNHPLFLDWQHDVLEAATRAAQRTTQQASNLSILQLPANLLETRGIQVAKDIQAFFQQQQQQQQGGNDASSSSSSSCMPVHLQVYAMRPLTCYPDQGTGTGHPFDLVDYQIPLLPQTDPVWTNEIDKNSPPAVYTQTLNATMAHFDGTELLEAKQERDLTAEERETLDGCKLLQSLLHDMDKGLINARSFAAHEQELLESVIPTLYGTLEEIDEESSQLLRAFFTTHSLAIRHAIAQNTRSLLRQGGEGVPTYPIPPTMRLQEYALQHLLDQEVFAKIIVGCSTPEEVNDDTDIAKGGTRVSLEE